MKLKLEVRCKRFTVLRTILHSFECFFIVILISYLACSHYMAYARLIFGPLPKFFCVMESFGMNSISVAGLLTADCLIITRVSLWFCISIKVGKSIKSFSVLVHFCNKELGTCERRFITDIYSFFDHIDIDYDWNSAFPFTREA